jgi:hypothetical protein
MKDITVLLLGILALLRAPAHALDIERVPPDVSATISNMASKIIQIHNVSDVYSTDYGNGEIRGGIICSLELVTNRLYARKSIVFRYDPKGFVSDISGSWQTNGNVLVSKEVEIEYSFLVDHPFKPPKYIRPNFPLDEKTWSRICAFVDTTKMQNTYGGKTYTLGGTYDIWTLYKHSEDIFSFHVAPDDIVTIDLKKKTYDVATRLGPR